MRAYILSTGDELVRGRTLDTNTSEIARTLCNAGFTVAGASLIGDSERDLASAILDAASQADVVVMSGGLGPTEDDCTRRAAASIAAVALERRQDLVDALEQRWALRKRPMPPSNLVQADMPVGADVLPNRHGTAAGFMLEVGDATLFALPGPPHEMRGVLQEEGLPRLRALIGPLARTVRTRTIETFGLSESRLGELLGGLMARDADPRVGTSAVRGTIRVILHAEGEVEEVERGIAVLEASVRERLGDHVFGVDGETLEQVVADALVRSGMTIAFAESCTGGLLAGRLTARPGVSAIFPGSVVTYSNEEKIRLLGVPEALIADHGVVSDEVARAMASGVRASFGTDVGVGVTGIAGPTGGTPEKPVGRVHLAVDVRGETTTRTLNYNASRDLVRELTVKSALDLVRRSLPRPAGS